MKSETIGISRGVAEASGVARKGDRLLVVSDADQARTTNSAWQGLSAP
jgi:hypothetical protein